MPGATDLEGDGVVLRTVEEDDLPFLRDVVNDPRVGRSLLNRPPLDLDDGREYDEEVVVGDDTTLNLMVWTVDDDGAGTRAGAIGLSGLDSPDGAAEVGLLLVPEAWGRGVGTEAARLVVGWAFDEGRLHRVVARVTDGNEASTRIWERLGVRREATLREAAFLDGRYVDQALHAVFEPEWREGT